MTLLSEAFVASNRAEPAPIPFAFGTCESREEALEARLSVAVLGRPRRPLSCATEGLFPRSKKSDRAQQAPAFAEDQSSRNRCAASLGGSLQPAAVLRT